MAKTKVPMWKVITKCYAKGTLWYEGDTVTDGDFSKNPCFEKIGEVEIEKDEIPTNNGQDIPPANGN